MNKTATLVKLAKVFSSLYNDESVGLIDVSSTWSKPEVHLTNEAFLATFSEYETCQRDDEKYPNENFVIVDDVKFFMIY